MSDFSSTPSSGPAQQNSSTAVISLVMGILGWSFFPVLGSIVAVITGHMAKKEIRESLGRLGGDGMATAGLILGYAGLVIMVLCICVFGIMLAMGMAIPFMDGSTIY